MWARQHCRSPSSDKIANGQIELTSVRFMGLRVSFAHFICGVHSICDLYPFWHLRYIESAALNTLPQVLCCFCQYLNPEEHETKQPIKNSKNWQLRRILKVHRKIRVVDHIKARRVNTITNSESTKLTGSCGVD